MNTNLEERKKDDVAVISTKIKAVNEKRKLGRPDFFDMSSESLVLASLNT